MIRNERQLGVARRKLRDLHESIQATIDAIDQEQYVRLAEDLEAEIREYEEIRDGILDRFLVESLDAVVDAAIKARIAKGWTQAQLAQRLGVSEQQVQKDEASGYARAGWDRIADVIDALGYELVGKLKPCDDTPLPMTGWSAPAEKHPVRLLGGTDTGVNTRAVARELLSAQRGQFLLRRGLKHQHQDEREMVGQ